MAWKKRLKLAIGLGLSGLMLLSAGITQQKASQSAQKEITKLFKWPHGKRAAVSLSFDDARLSQVDTGLALLKKHGVKVTFFVESGNLEKRLNGWKQAVLDGHEIGNH